MSARNCIKDFFGAARLLTFWHLNSAHANAIERPYCAAALADERLMYDAGDSATFERNSNQNRRLAKER